MKADDEIDWKKADLAFAEYALPFLLRRKMTEDEISALRQEARAYAAKRDKPAGKRK